MSINNLKINFAPNSANFDIHQDTWYKSAGLFVSQINKLINHSPIIKNIEEFNTNNSNVLQKILNKHGSDKGKTHNYHIIYNYIFRNLGLSNHLSILEIGLGTNDPVLVSTMGANGKPGASVKSFKEFLPNSNIYGADIDKKILFNENRITTSYIDQLDYTTFKNLNQIKYDVIIDDGLHSIGANLNVLIFALQNLKINGWIIIEDIAKAQIENWNIVDFSLSKYKNIDKYIVNTKHTFMYVIHKIHD